KFPADVAILAFAEQNNLREICNDQAPWFQQDPLAAQTVIPMFRCPSDSSPDRITASFVAGVPGQTVGTEFGTSSYIWSIGYNDSLSFGPNFGPRPVDRNSGVFAFESETTFGSMRDGASNTFAIGEGAGGTPLGEGPGATVPFAGPTFTESVHAWLIQGSNLPSIYGAGIRYAGGWGSTAQPMNKQVTDDSFFDESDPFNNNPSWGASDTTGTYTASGPHWASNFRSEHAGGGNFWFCDGSTQFIQENIDMTTYRQLSCIKDGGVIADY
ncbi:MAG: DUF1559 domain-containing protein, partial [Planctomycetota bacterium]